MAVAASKIGFSLPFMIPPLIKETAMRRGLMLGTLALLAAISLGALSAADKEKTDKKKEAAFCPVGGIGHDINKEVAVDFEGGKVNFCCEKCPAAFKKDNAKFAANARHQLLATGQIEQIACPLSGRKINPEKKAEVAGLEVAFCCENCQGKIAKTEKPEEKIALVFKDSLKDSKAFKVKKKDGAKAEKTETKS
jgi:YHS domain-containing protein